jgi:uncharacterized membrane protein
VTAWIVRLGTGLLASSFLLYPALERRGKVSENAARAFQILTGLVLVALHGALLFGWPSILRFMILSAAVGTAAETLGLRYGWFFGDYRYSDRVGPKCFGPLPLFVPILWIVLPYLGTLTACTVVFLASGRFPGVPRGDGFFPATVWVILTAVAVTAVDVVAEPVAVREGRWFWRIGGRYYGAPFSNFAGWFMTSLVLSAFWFGSGRVALRSAGAPVDVALLPVAGYGLFLLICSRACFEKKLRLAGWIGTVLGFLIFLVVFLAYFSYHFRALLSGYR